MNGNIDKSFFCNLIKMNDPTVTDLNSSDLEVEICESSFDTDAMWECDTNPNNKGRIDAPTYSNNFNVLQDPEKEVKKQNNAPARSSCFNCMGSHLISECPNPRDQRAIMKNRREFMNKSSGFFRQASRYHLGEDQMYAHMVPGKISNSLRHALGVSRNQLPQYVYRMRLFGYPPGWLEDARVSRSGIALYVDSQGNEIPTPDDEDGEIITDGSKDTYDVSKIHEFPGFNVPPDPDIIDETRFYRCPPLLEEQSKEMMVKELKSQKATASSYKKRASIPAHSPPGETAILKMDDDSNSTPGPTGSSLEEAATDKQARSSSPSLEDLEAWKQNLEAELVKKSTAAELESNSIDMEMLPSKKKSKKNRSNLKNAGSVVNDQPKTESSIAVGNQSSTPKVKHVALGTPASDRSTPYSRSCVTPVTKIGMVKQIEQGTPILKSASPYSLLPSPEKFSKNICDVINFENLPDSLGHYTRMNQVIHSVRNRLKNE